MAYKPSPRPSYDGPAHIPAASAIRHLWGDPISGQVPDWCYVSTDKIHQLVLGLLDAHGAILETLQDVPNLLTIHAAVLKGEPSSGLGGLT